MLLRLPLLAALLATSAAAFAAAPTITLPDSKTVSLSERFLAKLPRQSVSATAHGKTARYGGYDLRAVLQAAGVSTVALRGRAMTTTVTVSAPDGYRVVFALSELDPTLGNRHVLLADRENGQQLPAKDGPWRLVLPTDSRPARWEWQVETITVANTAPARRASAPGS